MDNLPRPTASSAPARFIESSANALYKQVRRLARDAAAARRQGLAWLEGDHLASAARQHGVRPALLVLAQSLWRAPDQAGWLGWAAQTVVLPDELFAALSALDSPARIGLLMPLPNAASAASPDAALDATAPTLVLDRVQDAGNVGSMLRCAAAFGFTQVLALPGTAALWGPKVLRAGMGAHFGLRLLEGVSARAVQRLAVPCLATSSHQGQWLHQAALPWPCAWLMGHEGQGLSPELAALARTHIRIAQPGGQESLNVAAAAAICLHASAAAALAASAAAPG